MFKKSLGRNIKILNSQEMFEKPLGRTIQVLKFSRKADRLRLDGLQVDFPAVDLQYLRTVACG